MFANYVKSNGANVRKLLIDSDVLIELTRNHQKALDVLTEYQRHYRLCVSSITRYELLIGSRNKQELRDLLQLLDTFETLPLNEAIAYCAERLLLAYNLSHNLQLADSLIASTALIHQIELLSRNKKDFAYIKELKLLAY